MATEDRWHDFAKEKPSEDMEVRDFIVSNGYSDTLSMWCGGYWENEPFMGNKLCDEVVRWKGYLTPEEEKANETTRTELDSYYYYEDIVLTPATHRYRVYHADDVDALLAKKDEEIDKQKWRGDEWAKACNQKDKEIESLKASHYAEMVDAGMRERRLRRLLWHAIALFCARSCEYFNGIMSHCLIGQNDLYRRCEEKKNKYLHAMYKCRAKAEEWR